MNHTRITPALLVAMSIALTVPAAAEAAEPVDWRIGTVTAAPQNRQEVIEVIASIAKDPDVTHLVVQFDGAVAPAQRAAINGAGLQLLAYLGGHAFFASVSPDALDADALAQVESLTDAKPIKRSWKLHPTLVAGEIPTWAVVGDRRGQAVDHGMVAAYVLFHRDVPLATDCVDAARRHGASVRSHLESINGLVVELPFANIRALADEDAVQWIEPPLPRMSAVNDSIRSITGVDIVQAPPYNLDGFGVTVLVYDAAYARESHRDFGGRLTARDSSGLSDHATHVSCTVGGDGSASDGLYRGIAPGVTIESYGFEDDHSGIFLYSNPGDMEDDYDEAINVHGADIANNSIGTNTCWNGFPCEITGDYGVTSALIDAIVRGSLGEPFRVVWANGNERDCPYCPGGYQNGYHSTAPPACAKNHISVGALNSNDDSQTSFTSWGPTDDGRLKPDLTAPGCQSDGDYGVTSCSGSSDTAYFSACGTSMAAPTVTGLSALLLQDYQAQYPGQPAPRNATLKTLLTHNAHDLAPPGPDYRTGYGSVRIQPTIDFMRTGNFLEGQVDQNNVYSVTLRVVPGDSQVKVTLAWDDVPGTPNVAEALVNDLDLRIYDPNGTQQFPWTLHPSTPGAPAVRTQADHVNNIEQVLVGSPTPGIWLVDIFGFNVPEGPQHFSLCTSPRLTSDCNENGILDYDEILAAPSLDCGGNGILDECEPDCDGDGTVDSCEIFEGTGSDCNWNGVPDDCEPDADCNENDLQDICDLATGFSADCNRNGLPDECDIATATSEDCNADTVPDDCERYLDCTENGIRDICDIAAGTSPDCNENEIPDECDIFDCGSPIGVCPGSGDCCNLQGNGTPGCDCASCCHSVCQDDSYCCDVEWDSICVNAARFNADCRCEGGLFQDGLDCNDNGVLDECDIADATSGDCNSNGVPDECDPNFDCNGNGVQDTCDVAWATSEDCNGNEVPDECEPDSDCNENDVQDICDLASGTSQDCNLNDIPDECDIANSSSGDCNINDIPDECEPDEDCNSNGVQDICEIASGASEDCNNNITPDECDLFSCGAPIGLCPGSGDCCEQDGNGTPGCDCASCCYSVCQADSYCCNVEWDTWCAFIARFSPDCDCGGPYQNWSEDCNSNERPDECDLADGTSEDCNGNGVPDTCDPDFDCNNNGVQDICDVAAGTSEDCNGNEVPDVCDSDCNGNSIPDECDVADGTSEDCNGNGIPDTCDPNLDCNNNGVQDICDVAAGTSEDCSKNEIPDECEEEDCNSNGVADSCDVSASDPSPVDSCSVAHRACAGITYLGTTEGMTKDGTSYCGMSDGPDAWYWFRSSESGALSVSLCGSSFDTVLSLWTDCPEDDGVHFICNDDSCGLQSRLTVNAAADRDYWIRIGGYGGASGAFELNLSGVGGTSGCDPVSSDCNMNQIPDECDVLLQDCNASGIPDECDVIAGTSVDCNSNQIPDECEADCNSNGTADTCDILDCGPPIGSCPGTGDCCAPFGNGSPGCDCAICCNAVCDRHPPCCSGTWDGLCSVIAAGTPECDCGGPGQPWSPDCNKNDVPDECDLADLTSEDCNDNLTPDECEQDEDGDGAIDDCDGCPMDSSKIDPGQCGCGESDLDTDGDAIANCVDPDDDNDGVIDTDDLDPLDAKRCQDVDGDTCDDCAVGSDGLGPRADNDPLGDGPDSDGDGICDAGDTIDIPTLSGWGLAILTLLLLVVARVEQVRGQRSAIRS